MNFFLRVSKILKIFLARAIYSKTGFIVYMNVFDARAIINPPFELATCGIKEQNDLMKTVHYESDK